MQSWHPFGLHRFGGFAKQEKQKTCLDFEIFAVDQFIWVLNGTTSQMTECHALGRGRRFTCSMTARSSARTSARTENKEGTVERLGLNFQSLRPSSRLNVVLWVAFCVLEMVASPQGKEWGRTRIQLHHASLGSFEPTKQQLW